MWYAVIANSHSCPDRRRALRRTGSAGTTMPTYDIRGISVEFPFKAYDLQVRAICSRTFIPYTGRTMRLCTHVKELCHPEA